MNVNRSIWTSLTTLSSILGGIVGYVIASYYSQFRIKDDQLLPPNSKVTGGDPFVPLSAQWPLIIVLTIGFAVIFFRLGSWLADHLVELMGRIHSTSAVDRVLGIAGALLGMIIGVLLTLPLANIASEQSIWLVVQFSVLAVCTASCMALMMGMRPEVLRVFPQLEQKPEVAEPTLGTMKLLDTNIIIDGRIAEICKTGFLEGPLVVPSFVLDEVQYFADSSDSLRRARGRRGLEVLNAVNDIRVLKPGSDPANKETVPLVRVLNDIPPAVRHVETVDGKLVALAKELHAAIVTNDFNLKGVAQLQGVRVLNLNELAQSLKPVVLPGEEMDLLLVKEGNQPGQGVGYLEDGTMVVVGDASRHVGETCRVVISSVYQTVAGKMIFADLKTKDGPSKGPGDDLFDGPHGPGPHGPGPHGNGHPKKRR